MRFKRLFLSLALLLFTGGLSLLTPIPAGSATAQSVIPRILNVVSPTRIPASASARGAVLFEDPQEDVTRADVHVIDGKFNPFVKRREPNRIDLTPDPDVRKGTLSFDLDCAFAEQQVTLKLQLVDRQGHRSRPERVSFTCGTPYIGNFDAERAQTHPTDRRVTMNLLVLDDGVNTLADGAVFPTPEAPIGEPRSELREAVAKQIVPAVNGIWDQCGLAFQLDTLGIVRPDRVRLSEGSLDERLFIRGTNLPEVAVANDPLEALTEALDPLNEFLRAQGGPLATDALTVFVSSARLVAHPGDQAQFGGVTYLKGRVSFVRWDAILSRADGSGRIVLPKRPVTAIAHEFGHNFGLGHVSEASDRQNLMFADPDRQAVHVPPQPPVELTASQCAAARDHVDASRLSDTE